MRSTKEMVIESHDEPEERLSPTQRGQQSLTNGDSTLLSLIIFLVFSKQPELKLCVEIYYL